MNPGGGNMSDSLVREQMRVLSLAEGFFQSNFLFALLRLNVFEHMGEGEISANELAEKLGVSLNRSALLMPGY